MNFKYISHIPSIFDEICVMYFSHDSYKMALQFLSTPIKKVIIKKVIIGSFFDQVSADLQPLKLFYWVCLSLQKFLPFKWKSLK